MDYLNWGAGYVGPVAWQLAAAAQKMISADAEGSNSSVKKDMDLSKLNEPITALASIIFLTTYEKKTKIGIKNNTIEYYPPHLFQGGSRAWNVVGKNDIQTSGILVLAVDVPQRYYKIGTEGAKAIARLQRISTLGLQALQKAYPDDYVPYYIQPFIKKCVRNYKENFPDKTDLEAYPEGFDFELYKEIEEKMNVGTIVSKPSSKTSDPNIGSDEQKTSETLGPDAGSNVEMVKPQNDVIQDISKLMWSVLRLQTLAGDCELAFSNFKAEDKNEFKLDSIVIETKIKNAVTKFQAILEEDKKSRYNPL